MWRIFSYAERGSFILFIVFGKCDEYLFVPCEKQQTLHLQEFTRISEFQWATLALWNFTEGNSTSRF